MNSSRNCGSTAGGSGNSINELVAPLNPLMGCRGTVEVGSSLTVLPAWPLARFNFGTRDVAISASALMHISALSSMYQGSLRPLCSVSM